MNSKRAAEPESSIATFLGNAELGTNAAETRCRHRIFGGALMSRAEEYLHYAAECIRVAKETVDPKDKALLLEMAQKWRELAERADRRGS